MAITMLCDVQNWSAHRSPYSTINECDIQRHQTTLRGPTNELQAIEEEDRDGSSRREDDDMERGFSLNIEQKNKASVLLYDPDQAESQILSVRGSEVRSSS